MSSIEQKNKLLKKQKKNDSKDKYITSILEDLENSGLKMQKKNSM